MSKHSFYVSDTPKELYQYYHGLVRSLWHEGRLSDELAATRYNQLQVGYQNYIRTAAAAFHSVADLETKPDPLTIPQKLRWYSDGKIGADKLTDADRHPTVELLTAELFRKFPER